MIQTKGDKLVKKCCQDISLIENYEEAISSPKRWCCHHRLETHDSDGRLREVFLTKDELEALDMYWNRPASELIFMSWTDHQKLHHNDVKVKSNHRKFGEANGMYGRHRTLEETAKRRKQVINTETNKVYNSLTEAAKMNNIPISTLCRMVKSGKSIFKYMEEK